MVEADGDGMGDLRRLVERGIGDGNAIGARLITIGIMGKGGADHAAGNGVQVGLARRKATERNT